MSIVMMVRALIFSPKFYMILKVEYDSSLKSLAWFGIRLYLETTWFIGPRNFLKNLSKDSFVPTENIKISKMHLSLRRFFMESSLVLFRKLWSRVQENVFKTSWIMPTSALFGQFLHKIFWIRIKIWILAKK